MSFCARCQIKVPNKNKGECLICKKFVCYVCGLNLYKGKRSGGNKFSHILLGRICFDDCWKKLKKEMEE